MQRLIVPLIAAAALAAPGSALAAPQLAAPIAAPKVSQSTGAGTPGQLPLNYVSDRRALNAYANYLTALLNGAPTGDANDTTYISSIANQCKSALAPLTQPGQQVNTDVQHTLTVLGEEMGDDLAINFDQAATPAFARFSGTLSRLRWTRLTGWLLTIKHYVDAETTVLTLPASALCQNASYAALRPDVVPDGTKTFIKAYKAASSVANAALANLMKLMQSYEIPSEKTLVARISNLAGAVSSQTKADLLESGTALTSVLESN